MRTCMLSTATAQGPVDQSLPITRPPAGSGVRRPGAVVWTPVVQHGRVGASAPSWAPLLYVYGDTYRLPEDIQSTYEAQVLPGSVTLMGAFLSPPPLQAFSRRSSGQGAIRQAPALALTMAPPVVVPRTSYAGTPQGGVLRSRHTLTYTYTHAHLHTRHDMQPVASRPAREPDCQIDAGVRSLLSQH